MRGSTTTLLGTAVVAATCLVPFADGDAVRADHETPVVELLTDIDDVPVDAEIDHLTATSTHVFFEARGSVAFGRELWAYSIADDETSMVHDLSEGWDDTDILATTVVDDTFYFVAEVGGATRLWTSDGTESGTDWLGSLFDVNDRHLVSAGSVGYVTGVSASTGEELVRFDGAGNVTVIGGDRQPRGHRAVGAGSRHDLPMR